MIWTGSDDGVIERTSDGGAHWSDVTPRAIAWARVATVEPSHFSSGRAYAVVDRHLLGDPAPYIFATDDAGMSWRRIDAGLPRKQTARVVREDPLEPDVLYAGLEQGAWISFDRGMHWTSLQLGMAPTAVRDLRIVPKERALIAGTHGRGLWILDDLTPLESLAAAERRAVPALFAPRPAHTWYFWWASGYPTGDDECCSAPGTGSGANPPDGALLTYYLPKALAPAPHLEVFDAHGRSVRPLRATNHAGLNRIAWNLCEPAPVPLHSARSWNRGPAKGPLVVPGTYTIRLEAGGQRAEQRLEVLADPRAPWRQAQYEARYRFLRALDRELSGIDAALNRLQALRSGASPSLRGEIDQLTSLLTSGVVNSEDDMWRGDRLRERLTILQGTVALSQGPPLLPHVREAAAVHAEYARAMDRYATFLAANHLEHDATSDTEIDR